VIFFEVWKIPPISKTNLGSLRTATKKAHVGDAVRNNHSYKISFARTSLPSSFSRNLWQRNKKKEKKKRGWKHKIKTVVGSHQNKRKKMILHCARVCNEKFKNKRKTDSEKNKERRDKTNSAGLINENTHFVFYIKLNNAMCSLKELFYFSSLKESNMIKSAFCKIPFC